MIVPTEDDPGLHRMRIDKWLWVARFYKTRSLAVQAITAGHVKCAGHAVKPAREVASGDCLDLTIGDAVWTIVIRGILLQRRPASEAAQLFEETEVSKARRRAQREAQDLAPVPGSERSGRPSKKARRQIHRFIQDG